MIESAEPSASWEYLTFGGNFRQARLERGVTQIAASQNADVSLRRLALYENGDVLPQGATAKRLVGGIGIDGLDPLSNQLSDMLVSERTEERRRMRLRKDAFDETGFFVADKDIVDSLKMDTSTLSPKEAARLTEKASDFQDSLLELWGNHISPEMKANATDISSRTFVVDPSVFNLMRTDWALEKKRRINAMQITYGDLIILEEFHVNYKLLSRDIRAELEDALARAGDNPEIAAQTFGQAVALGIFAHELIHAYQIREKFELLAEWSAEYYADSLIERSEIDFFRDVLADLRSIRIYEILLEEFGEELHDVVFGNTSHERSLEVQGEILEFLRPLFDVVRS